ncbi:hypothetical protein [Geodermatophilus sp. DSM 45219]|uniref:hypothetical protein n=1 Tax=Geodermatophilus sp. DSM 45219 TaxID=1881103 RepID=UPI00088B02AD|nr:hypothetical protein [Geodermatophilus sp. DSM 45219]SDO14946.1 hypothetical protein SAMN05428965_2869 [Geodermatophilus sp. DSM 45219]
MLLTQPYRWGSTVSQVDVGLRKVRGQWDVVGTEATALRTKDLPEDPDVLAATAEAHATTVYYVDQVVATSTEELTTATSWYQDTPILDFIQHVQTETVDTRWRAPSGPTCRCSRSPRRSAGRRSSRRVR